MPLNFVKITHQYHPYINSKSLNLLISPPLSQNRLAPSSLTTSLVRVLLQIPIATTRSLPAPPPQPSTPLGHVASLAVGARDPVDRRHYPPPARPPRPAAAQQATLLRHLIATRSIPALRSAVSSNRHRLQYEDLTVAPTSYRRWKTSPRPCCPLIQISFLLSFFFSEQWLCADPWFKVRKFCGLEIVVF